MHTTPATLTTHADHATTHATIGADHGTTRTPVAVTIREAANMVGTTRDSIRGRVERGTLRSVVGSDGKRRIPVSELERAGLLGDHASDHATDHSMGSVGYHDHAMPTVVDFMAMIRDLQQQHADAVARAVAAETRLEAVEARLQIEEKASSTIELELHEARARAAVLEHELQAERTARMVVAERPRRRSWFRMGRRDHVQQEASGSTASNVVEAGGNV